MFLTLPAHHPRSRWPAPAVHPTSRAFTLIETLVSLAIMAILFTGVGSVFMLASRSLPTARGPSERTIATTAALDQLAGDLRLATRVTEATPTAITFNVPDRNNEGHEETIRYALDGNGALTYRINNSQPTPLLRSVSAFNLAYTKRHTTTTGTTTTTADSGEVTLASFGGWAGVPSPNTLTKPLTTTSWAAQAFTVDKVTFPPDTTQWYITRVSLRTAKGIVNFPTISVAVCRPASTGSPLPGAQVGTAGTIAPGLLAISPGWQDATVSNVSFTDINARNLVLLMKADSAGGIIEYLSSASAPADGNTFLYCTDSGVTWLPASGRDANDAKFFVYGGYQRAVQTTTVVDAWALGSVNITLQPTPDAATRIDTGLALLNQPLVPGP